MGPGDWPGPSGSTLLLEPSQLRQAGAQMIRDDALVAVMRGESRDRVLQHLGLAAFRGWL
jgi:hypothetical protein